jgi:fimbrial isopeptide formation D2 family protein/uncharacterized repeat protein (TIGR01451 family)
MKRHLKSSLDLDEGTRCTTTQGNVPTISAIGIRVSRIAFVLPLVTAGMGIAYLPQPAQALTAQGTVGCPTGTRLGPNGPASGGTFIRNGNFATTPGRSGQLTLNNNNANFGSDLPYRGDNVYPDDEGVNNPNGTQGPEGSNIRGGLSIQNGNIEYAGGIVTGRPLPADPQNGVPASNTYLYSNPFKRFDGTPGNNDRPSGVFQNPIVWQQRVTGLQPNTTYNFSAYFLNLLNPNNPTVQQLVGQNPLVRLRIESSNSIESAQREVTERGPNSSPLNGWVRIEYAFTTGTGETEATLSVVDTANNVLGDDFGLAAIGINECVPLPEIRKSVTRLRDNNNNGVLDIGDDLQYTISVINRSSTNIAGLVIRDAIPTQLQILQEGGNTIQFPNGFTRDSNLPTTNFNGGGFPSNNPTVLTSPGTLPGNGTINLVYNARILEGAPSTINNQASARFTGDGGQPIISDASDSTNREQPGSGQNPGNPDAQGNINQPNAGPADPTIVNLAAPRPIIRKSVSRILNRDNNNNGILDSGDDLRYTITVTNPGTTPINNLVIRDFQTTALQVLRDNDNPVNIDQGFTIAGIPGTTFNGSDTPIQFSNGGTLNPGQTVTLTYNARIQPIAPSRITNQASANFDGDAGQPILSDASDSPATNAPGTGTPENAGNPNEQGNVLQLNANAADPTIINLSAPRPIIRKSVRRVLNRDNNNNGILDSGDDLEYVITVTNPGTTPINNLVISDYQTPALQVLRDGNNPISVDSGFTLANDLPGSTFPGREQNNPIAFTNGGTLNPNQTVTLRYFARIQPGATGTITNQASGRFTGDGGQPIISDASDSPATNAPGTGTPENAGNPDEQGNVRQLNANAADPTILNLGTTSISGILYRDTVTQNNTFDPTEPRLPANITVRLVDSNNNPVRTTTTDANGQYSFTNVPNGSYTIQVDTTDSDIPSGLRLTSPQNNSIPVQFNGTPITNQNFGFLPSGISGTLYRDSNPRNDTFDSGETGLPANITVRLLDPNGNPVQTTTTNASGQFNFTDVPNGTYTIQVDTNDPDIPPGFSLRSPSNNSRPVTFNGTAVTGQDFGFVPSGLTGTLFVDNSPENGRLDPNEPRLPSGITLRLLNPNGNLIQTTETNANGQYSFPDIPAGNYLVEIDPNDPDIPQNSTFRRPRRVGANVPPQGLVLDFPDTVAVAAANPNLRLIKRITSATRNNAPISGVAFDSIDPSDNAADITTAGGNPRGVRDIPNTTTLVSGDEVEYTIYYVNTGGTANSVNFCDLIPAGTNYVPNSTQLQLGNGQLTQTGRFFGRLAPLPNGSSCIDNTNPNGTVIVDLGNVPGTQGNNYGLVRFRVRVN